jgi:hypothetical protein
VFESIQGAFNLAPSSAVCALKEELGHKSMQRLSKVFKFLKLGCDIPKKGKQTSKLNPILSIALLEAYLKCKSVGDIMAKLTRGNSEIEDILWHSIENLTICLVN